MVNTVTAWSLVSSTIRIVIKINYCNCTCGGGGTVLVHLCNWGLIPVLYNYLVKVALATSEKSVVQYDSTKHCRFSNWVLHFLL